jgi:hypothetical protein
MHKKSLEFNQTLGRLSKQNMYNNNCNPPNTLYSFLLHPISNKIPSPKRTASAVLFTLCKNGCVIRKVVLK